MAYQFMIKKKKDPKTKKYYPEAFIYLRYSYKDFQDCLISAGIKIDSDHWDEKKGKPAKGYPGGRVTLERKLNALKGAVMEAATALENEGELPIPEEVKKRYNEKASGIFRGAIKAVTLWEQMIKDGDGKKDPKTIANETNSMTSFVEYLESIKKPAITPRKITKEIISGYEKHLSKYADNTRAKKLKHFKAFLKSIEHPSTKLIKAKEHPGDKIYLTEDELTAIENHAFEAGSRFAIARDLLSLQCETGLRVSDLKRVSREHIQGNALLIRAKKNDQFIRMPISLKIAEILSRYNHDLPRMADQTYNEVIKLLAADAIPESKVELTEHRGGVKTKVTCFKHEILTSHCNVRTFINLAAARGMPIVSIASLTGKSVATLLKAYLKPDAEQAFKDAQEYGRVPMVANR